MSEAYDNIPRKGGTHRGEVPEEHKQSSMNVRAPGPPDRAELTGDAAEGTSEPPSGRVRRLAYNEEKDRYRVQVGTEDESALEEGYEETGRYTSDDDLAAALGELPSPPRFVVFEHTETGETHLERNPDLASDWMQENRFNQATLFNDEDEAEAYAG